MRPYTTADWHAENTALQHGVDPQPCPSCGRTGFYATRDADPAPGKTTRRLYRACKFCGFWQDADADPVPHRATAHDCRHWPQILGTPYLWWVGPGEVEYTCDRCKQTVTVASALRPLPADDPQHPWWSVPQHRSQAYYLAYFLGQGCDRRPFGVL